MNHNITIKISTASAAFANHEACETAHILRGIADKLDNADWRIRSLEEALLYDRKGCKVGTIRVTGGGR